MFILSISYSFLKEDAIQTIFCQHSYSLNLRFLLLLLYVAGGGEPTRRYVTINGSRFDITSVEPTYVVTMYYLIIRFIIIIFIDYRRRQPETSNSPVRSTRRRIDGDRPMHQLENIHRLNINGWRINIVPAAPHLYVVTMSYLINVLCISR